MTPNPAYRPSCATCGTSSATVLPSGYTVCDPCGQIHGRCTCEVPPDQNDPRELVSVALPDAWWDALITTLTNIADTMDSDPIPQAALRLLLSDLEGQGNRGEMALIRWQWFQIRETLHMMADVNPASAKSAHAIADTIASQMVVER